MPLFLLSKYHCTSISCIFACRCCCGPPRSFSTYLSDRCSADLPTHSDAPSSFFSFSLLLLLLLLLPLFLHISCSSHRRRNQLSGCRGGTRTRRVYLFNLFDQKRVDWIHRGLLMNSWRSSFFFFILSLSLSLSLSIFSSFRLLLSFIIFFLIFEKYKSLSSIHLHIVSTSTTPTLVRNRKYIESGYISAQFPG